MRNILLLSLFLIGFGGLARADYVPQVLSKPEPALKLDFGCDLHYLPVGDVYEQEERPASFKVVNASQEPQTIVSIVATCDCTRLLTHVENAVLQPVESLQVEFEVLAAKMLSKKFARNFLIKYLGGPTIKAQYAGQVVEVVKVGPERIVDLPFQKTPDAKWEVLFELKRNPMLEKVVLAAPAESRYFAFDFQDLGDGSYALKVTPKADLPYSRKFTEEIHVPVVEPAQARFVKLEISVPVAESVFFTPDKWTIARSALEAAGSLTGRFAYGVVPGLQEDETIEAKDMMRPRKLRQKSAVPLKFVREHHDWDDLFGHLELRVPEGLAVEKLRHPTGIELQVTVTPDCFADSKTLQITPFRGANDCQPIVIELVEE